MRMKALNLVLSIRLKALTYAEYAYESIKPGAEHSLESIKPMLSIRLKAFNLC